MQKTSLLLLSLLAMSTVPGRAATPITILKTRNPSNQVVDSEVVQAVRSRIDTAKYREIKVQLIHDSSGQNSHYLVYLHSKQFHRVDFARIPFGSNSRTAAIQENYRLQEIDFKDQIGVEATHAACPDNDVRFIAFAPNNIQLEQDVTVDVADAAAARMKTVRLLKAQATHDAYLNYMSCPNIQGNFYDGDANPQVITTVDGVIRYDEINTLLAGKFHHLTTSIWLACEAYNNPMLAAVVDAAQAKKYAAGINNLAVGPSDKAAACAMKKAIAGQPMHASFNTCYAQLDVSTDKWGFGGNGSDNFWSNGYDCAETAPNPVVKFDHKDAAGRVYIPVQNSAAIPNDLFVAAPELPACGLNKNSSRTWIDIFDATTRKRIYGFCAFGSNTDLKGIWFMPSTPHGKVYIQLNDRGCSKIHKSNTVSW